jgi:hypothetical protein
VSCGVRSERCVVRSFIALLDSGGWIEKSWVFLPGCVGLYTKSWVFLPNCVELYTTEFFFVVRKTSRFDSFDRLQTTPVNVRRPCVDSTSSLVLNERRQIDSIHSSCPSPDRGEIRYGGFMTDTWRIPYFHQNEWTKEKKVSERWGPPQRTAEPKQAVGQSVNP